MNITLEEFIDIIVKLQSECNGGNEPDVRKKVHTNVAMMGEFDIAYQTAIAVFCTQKGDQSGVDTLREYLNEAYTGKDLSVGFK